MNILHKEVFRIFIFIEIKMSCVNCNKTNYQQLISAYFGRSSDAVLPTKKNIYPLIGNMFEKCSVYYDDSADELLLATDDQTYKCCLDNCSPSIDFCHDNCHKQYGDQSSNPDNIRFGRCRDKCNTMTDDCVTLCTHARGIWGDNDPFVQEAKKIGCWDLATNQPKPECIKQNKKHLYEYCMRNCNPTANMSCEDHCNTSYNLATDPEKVSNIFKNTIPRTTLHDLKDNTGYHTSIGYILVGVFGGILLGMAVYMIIRYKVN